MLRKLLPSTLFWRFALIIFLPVIILQAISIYIFYERHWDTLSRRLADSLAGDIEMIVFQLSSEEDFKERSYMIDVFRRSLMIHAEFLPYVPLLEGVEEQDLPAAEQELYRALNYRLDIPFMLRPVDDYEQVMVGVQLNDGLLTLTTNRKRLFSSTTYIFILWMISLAVVFTFLSIVFMRNQIRPIRRLAVAVDNFGKGRDVPGFRPQGAQEVRQAAEAFNVMRERIQRQITQRTEMLAGVSHDLRTPLTRLKLQLALMKDSDPGVQDMRTDLDEMAAMIDAYLNFARGEGQEKTALCDLSEIIEQAVAGAIKSGSNVSFTAPAKSVHARLRPNGIRRCLDNVISNAHKYANKAEIHLKKRPHSLQIIIDDDGPGIPEDQREDVFRPFNRLDASRNQDTSGVGLGLTIARDIARGHGGDIELDNSPLGGLRVIIKLPV